MTNYISPSNDIGKLWEQWGQGGLNFLVVETIQKELKISICFVPREVVSILSVGQRLRTRAYFGWGKGKPEKLLGISRG